MKSSQQRLDCQAVKVNDYEMKIIVNYEDIKSEFKNADHSINYELLLRGSSKAIVKDFLKKPQILRAFSDEYKDFKLGYNSEFISSPGITEPINLMKNTWHKPLQHLVDLLTLLFFEILLQKTSMENPITLIFSHNIHQKCYDFILAVLNVGLTKDNIVDYSFCSWLECFLLNNFKIFSQAFYSLKFYDGNPNHYDIKKQNSIIKLSSLYHLDNHTINVVNFFDGYYSTMIKIFQKILSEEKQSCFYIKAKLILYFVDQYTN